MKMYNLQLFCLFFLFISCASFAQETRVLKEYQWKNRLLLVYTNSEESSSYQQQLLEIKEHIAGFEERDLVLFTILPEKVITPQNKVLSTKFAESLRQQYEIPNSDITVVLIGKDGGRKLKQQDLLTADKLFGLIDQMPMRQREMRSN